MKKLFSNIFLAMISAILTLSAAEFVLRLALNRENETLSFLKKPLLYAGYDRDPTEHLYKEDYWKMRFLFSNAESMQEPHPLLGWSGNFHPTTYEHADEFYSKGKRPVLLFGDSFSQCVDTTQCFEHFLNTDTSFNKTHYLLNYGVGGYGVDQIHLLMQQVVKRFENPIVIFGMLTTDLDRSMLRFRDAPKPYFELEKDKLKLKRVPIELGASAYIEQYPIKINCYVLRVCLNGLNWLLNIELNEQSQKKIKDLNESIIREQIAQLRNAELEPTMLLFQPMKQRNNEWRSIFLLDLFNELELDVIDARKVLLEEIHSTGISEEAYFIAKDLHPNSEYNRIIAQSIRSEVLGQP